MPPNPMAPRATPMPSRAPSATPRTAPAPQSMKPSAPPSRPRSKAGRNIIAALVLLAVGYVAGYVCGMYIGFGQGMASATKTVATKLAASDMFPQTTPLHFLSGTVTAVSGNGFDIQVAQTVRNPLETQAPLARTVNVTTATKLSQQVRLTDAQLKAESDAFDAAMKKFDPTATPPQTPPTPPQPFTQKDITLSDLQKGMVVSVAADADLTMTASFTATTVTVQAPLPAAPPTPPPATPPTTPPAAHP